MLFVAALCLAAGLVLGDRSVGGRANAGWTCSGCRNEQHEQVIYGYVHSALHHQREERLVFLSAVDMSWTEELTLPDSIVHVTVIDGDQELPTLLHSATTFAYYNSTSSSSSTISTYSSDVRQYHLAVAELPPHMALPRDLRHPLHNIRRQHAAHAAATPVFANTDRFLLANPCWVPLSEPVIFNGLASSPVLLLGALPKHRLGATCRFLHTLMASQFPGQCPDTPAGFSKINLPNIGFASVVVQLVDGLADVFCNECKPPYKVFVTPRAEDFYSRKLNVTDPTTGKTNVSHDGWSWADPESCPLHTQTHDPWACNFLSLSNCSDRHKTAAAASESMHIWFTPSNFLRGHRLALEDRRAGGSGGEVDAPLASDEQWAQARFSAFVLRPNAQMRQRIRASFRQIVTLGGGGGVGGALGLAPCVAVHIRHGDGSLDHRAQSGVDRSAVAHVAAADPLLRALGTRKVFLMTDNVTVLETLDQQYPQLSFHHQRRPMSQKVQFFKQFTHKYDSKDNTNEEEDMTIVIPGAGRGANNNVTTNPSLRESVAETLAHILADWRAATVCSAIVGAFDSGYSQRMYTSMCGLGQCPPSVDLRKPKG